MTETKMTDTEALRLLPYGGLIAEPAIGYVVDLIADRDRLSAEVLRLQDAVMESDARSAALLTALKDALGAGSQFSNIAFNLGQRKLYDTLSAQDLGTMNSCRREWDAMRDRIRPTLALSPATSTGETK